MPCFHDYRGEKPDDSRINEERYANTLHTHHTHKFYYYPGCISEQLHALQNFHAPDPELVRWWRPRTLDHATSTLKAFLAEPPSDLESDAIRRLDTAWKDKTWTPDVAAKSFHDVDLAYFGGQLKGRCAISWIGSNEAMRHAHTNRLCQVALGITSLHPSSSLIGPPMVQIQLNADMIFRTPALQEHSGLRQTFGTLVHGMLHAYLMTTCTIPQIQKYGGAPDPSHGPHFIECVVALDNRTFGDLGLEVTWATKPDAPKEFVRYPRP
ncbi:hypothetical protein MMC30_003213 [Trapelia coarctata]|nr:hypothetical protein [Trapelia coarctata]